MFLNAHTTAKTQKRHESVLKSKYDRYYASGGTMNDVISAAKAAMHITALFLTNDNTFNLNTPFQTNVVIKYSTMSFIVKIKH